MCGGDAAFLSDYLTNLFPVHMGQVAFGSKLDDGDNAENLTFNS